MTREEEIIGAASKYSEYEFNECAANNGFIKGAEWADNHPINVWHDANEEPTENYINIIYQTHYYSKNNIHITFIPTCLRSCKITSHSWNEFIKEVNMKRWAYIDDLLPKE